eukprot:TRINITY_DN773121_c0_g1_i1.p1 TRINITY_DN773121_c0_g1~~TRINITY_DN773121_c0_g1_i1.p1  ORF type:complete len:167 (+),score=44.86 TRINITY_DN773121_c0_g1_i1:74-574(+)
MYFDEEEEGLSFDLGDSGQQKEQAPAPQAPQQIIVEDTRENILPTLNEASYSEPPRPPQRHHKEPQHQQKRHHQSHSYDREKRDRDYPSAPQTRVQIDSDDAFKPLFSGGRKTAFDVNLNNMSRKPWEKPGEDISDYFNYGFDERSWRDYCAKQQKFRREKMQKRQ